MTTRRRRTCNCMVEWRNCQGRLAPAPALLFDWGKPSFPPLPFSSCAWTLISTATPLSVSNVAVAMTWSSCLGYLQCLCLAWRSLHVIFMPFNSFMVTVMGLVISWSTTLLVVDAYSVFVKCLRHQRRLILIIILGDMVLSYLTLAAACSTASVTDLLLDADESYCPAKLCGRYQLSAAMAFLAWFLSSASCLFNFWLLPCL